MHRGEAHLQDVVDGALRVFDHLGAEVVRLQGTAALPVNPIPLGVQHLVVLKELPPNVEEVRLHLQYGTRRGGCQQQWVRGSTNEAPTAAAYNCGRRDGITVEGSDTRELALNVQCQHRFISVITLSCAVAVAMTQSMSQSPIGIRFASDTCCDRPCRITLKSSATVIEPFKEARTRFVVMASAEIMARIGRAY